MWTKYVLAHLIAKHLIALRASANCYENSLGVKRRQSVGRALRHDPSHAVSERPLCLASYFFRPPL
jgi:hypothetical protein